MELQLPFNMGGVKKKCEKEGEELKDVCENSVWKQDVAQQVVLFGWGVSDLPHKLTAFKVQEVAEKKIGKWLVIYQIWYFKSISNKMPGKRTIILSASVCLSSSLDTHTEQIN